MGIKSTFRVMTYNIHKGRGLDGITRVLPDLKKAITSTGCQIMALQEVKGSEQQFEFLADQVWTHHSYGQNAVYPGGHHGNAVLSEFPIAESFNLKLTANRVESRGALHVRLDLKDGNETFLHLITLHLSLFARERSRQLRVLAAYIQDKIPSDQPLVICGDFNDWDLGVHYKIKEELSVTEAFESLAGKVIKTFPSFMPLLPLDRIYFRNLDVVNSELVNGKNFSWSRISDHLPIYVDFHYPKKTK
ncbi:MAG: endonuclease/exonuclease/phosphatase family protein [Bdellovibrionales bacterium]|nr:endonuclease/exonuclease/phosphatase family protein [Bdellovibrionales bacterium]